MAKTAGSTPTIVTGWRVLVPDEYGGDPRVVYEGPSYTDAREARRKDGAPRASFVRVDVDRSQS